MIVCKFLYYVCLSPLYFRQLQSHASKVKEIEEELESLRKNPPGKKAKSAVINDYNERNAFYQFELRRFKTYQVMEQVSKMRMKVGSYSW